MGREGRELVQTVIVEGAELPAASSGPTVSAMAEPAESTTPATRSEVAPATSLTLSEIEATIELDRIRSTVLLAVEATRSRCCGVML